MTLIGPPDQILGYVAMSFIRSSYSVQSKSEGQILLY